MRTLLRALGAVSGLFVLIACGSDSSPAGGDGGGGNDGGGGGGNGASTCTSNAPVDNAWLADPKMCLTVFASDLGAARQMAFAPNGDLFVAIGGAGQVVALYDADKDGASAASERSTFASAPDLNHGVAFSRDGAYLYASSATTIYRWAYASGDRTAKGAAEVVVKDMLGGGHDTRTLVFDSTGRLYVNVGSSDNVETDANLSVRAQVRRFTIPASIPQGGIDYAQGEVVASGLRNEVGLFVDGDDHLWGVENGRDDLVDKTGVNVHNDNPGEEINLLDAPGARFYGYPFCWSEGKLANGQGPTTQWADTTIPAAMQKTDAWCRDTANVQPPKFAMTAHWAPLGILQYTGGALPFRGDFLITSHGSWDKTPASGRVLAHATLKDGAITAVTPIVGQRGEDGNVVEGTWDARPVDVRQGAGGEVYFSDDLGGRVFRLGYAP